MTVPVGGIVFACIVLLAVAPIRRPRTLALTSWISTATPNELPIQFAAIVTVSGLPSILDGNMAGAGDWLSLAMFVFTVAGLAVVAGRTAEARGALERALDDALPATWRNGVSVHHRHQPRRHLPWARILLMPWPFRPRAVVRTSDIAYHDAGPHHRLDIYRHRSRPMAAPTLVHLHGGGFTRGHKSFESRPLLHHLARHGWTCISANYHLDPTPAAAFPENLVDVKGVIAWARCHGPEYGVDPNRIVMAGSSAGAHLTVMAALTADRADLQPGFETADTSIAAGIGLYGYYGPVGDRPGLASTPLAHSGEGAPPLLLVHGDHDTFTPIEGARCLAAGLRATSTRPVVLAELPGAQHSFDVFHSIRYEAVVDAISAFATYVLYGDQTQAASTERGRPTDE